MIGGSQEAALISFRKCFIGIQCDRSGINSGGYMSKNMVKYDRNSDHCTIYGGLEKDNVRYKYDRFSFR